MFRRALAAAFGATLLSGIAVSQASAATMEFQASGNVSNFLDETGTLDGHHPTAQVGTWSLDVRFDTSQASVQRHDYPDRFDISIVGATYGKLTLLGREFDLDLLNTDFGVSEFLDPSNGYTAYGFSSEFLLPDILGLVLISRLGRDGNDPVNSVLDFHSGEYCPDRCNSAPDIALFRSGNFDQGAYDRHGNPLPSQMGGGTFDLQSVTLTYGVPEPATWALMLLGFAGAGAALRRLRLASTATSAR